MDVISYNQYEIDSKIERSISYLYERFYGREFNKNPTLTRYILKLSNEYNRYKEQYNFPIRYKGNYNWKNTFNKFHIEFDFASNLHYMKINFDTPKFEKITKDRAAKFVDMLSAIGGTMGLLTGFSIISGVEIIHIFCI